MSSSDLHQILFGPLLSCSLTIRGFISVMFSEFLYKIILEIPYRINAIQAYLGKGRQFTLEGSDKKSIWILSFFGLFFTTIFLQETRFSLRRGRQHDRCSTQPNYKQLFFAIGK